MVKKVRTVGCFLEYNGKFLILHRMPHESQGDRWGLPAGKVDEGESEIDTMLREIEEETGYKPKKDELEFIKTIVWNFPEKTVEFITFRIKLNNKINVKLNPNEHQAYKWVTPKECYAMKNLIHGFHDLLEKMGYVK